MTVDLSELTLFPSGPPKVLKSLRPSPSESLYFSPSAIHFINHPKPDLSL